jgi:hypothetical protein
VPVPLQIPFAKKVYVTVPVTPLDGKPPVILAWSVTGVFAVTVVDGVMVVVKDGVAMPAVRGSLPHGVATMLLLASPLYVEIHWNVPVLVGANAAD